MKQIFYQVLEKIMNYCKKMMKRLQLNETNCETINIEDKSECRHLLKAYLFDPSCINANDRTKSSSNKSELLEDLDKMINNFNRLIPDDLNADSASRHSLNKKSSNFPTLSKNALNLLNKYLLLILVPIRLMILNTYTL